MMRQFEIVDTREQSCALVHARGREELKGIFRIPKAAQVRCSAAKKFELSHSRISRRLGSESAQTLTSSQHNMIY